MRPLAVDCLDYYKPNNNTNNDDRGENKIHFELRLSIRVIQYVLFYLPVLIC